MLVVIVLLDPLVFGMKEGLYESVFNEDMKWMLFFFGSAMVGIIVEVAMEMLIAEKNNRLSYVEKKYTMKKIFSSGKWKLLLYGFLIV